MQVIQQAFSHSSSSIMIGKIQGNIVDISICPSNSRRNYSSNKFCCMHKKSYDCISFYYCISFIVDLEFYNFFYIFIYTFLGSFILSSIGIIIGLWAEKFDHMASATNFIIVPLSFLSGTFYSIDRLPEVLKL